MYLFIDLPWDLDQFHSSDSLSMLSSKETKAMSETIPRPPGVAGYRHVLIGLVAWWNVQECFHRDAALHSGSCLKTRLPSPAFRLNTQPTDPAPRPISSTSFDDLVEVALHAGNPSVTITRGSCCNICIIYMSSSLEDVTDRYGLVHSLS